MSIPRFALYVVAIVLLIEGCTPTFFAEIGKKIEPSSDGAVFNVKDYGATGDGNAHDHDAISSAISACSSAGGGIVLVPAGDYRCGTIYFKSNVNLHLETGTTIFATSERLFAEPIGRSSLILGESLTNVSITGTGTIDGRFYDDGLSGGSSEGNGKGGRAITFGDVKGLEIRDIKVKDAGHFPIIIWSSDGVLIDGIYMKTNRDGINLMGCVNAVVSNSYIESIRYDQDSDGNWYPDGGDDAICIKTLGVGQEPPNLPSDARGDTENITIKNLEIVSGCSALYIKPGGGYDARNVNISNVKITSAKKAGILITSRSGDSVVHDINIDNIEMTGGHGVAAPIYMAIVETGRIHDVKLSNITVNNHRHQKGIPADWDDVKWTNAIFGNSPDHPIGPNIVLENVNMRVDGGGSLAESRIVPPDPITKSVHYPRGPGIRPAFGFWVRHATGLVFRNNTITTRTADYRPCIFLDDVDGVEFDTLDTVRHRGSAHTIELRDVTDFQIHNSPGMADVQSAYKASTYYTLPEGWGLSSGRATPAGK